MHVMFDNGQELQGFLATDFENMAGSTVSGADRSTESLRRVNRLADDWDLEDPLIDLDDLLG